MLVLTHTSERGLGGRGLMGLLDGEKLHDSLILMKLSGAPQITTVGWGGVGVGEQLQPSW